MLAFDPGLLMVTSGRVMGATLCPFPAFQQAYVYLVSGDDVVDTQNDDVTLVASGSLAARRDAQVVVWTPIGDDALFRQRRSLRLHGRVGKCWTFQPCFTLRRSEPTGVTSLTSSDVSSCLTWGVRERDTELERPTFQGSGRSGGP
jgi:hypothetical protein